VAEAEGDVTALADRVAVTEADLLTLDSTTIPTIDTRLGDLEAGKVAFADLVLSNVTVDTNLDLGTYIAVSQAAVVDE
jgi:hypothetical protein